jgi:diaminopimelate epimerase
VKYYKYDASGNTFVIFNSVEKDYTNEAITLCKQCNSDGLIVVVPHEKYDFKWLFYNNDGSIANMCGNGTRAVAHFAYNNKLAPKKMSFLTGAGVIRCEVDGDIVETTLTKPQIIKKPFIDNEFNIKLFIIDTGVPHIVIFDDINKFDKTLCQKLRYKYNANCNYAQVIDNKLYVRTYERGVEDETLACGTGMVASFLRAKDLGLVTDTIKVYPLSKEELQIRLQDGLIYFKGAVKYKVC